MKGRNNLNQNWNFPKFVFKLFLFCMLILLVQLSYLALSPNIYGINMDTFAANRNTVEKTLYATRGTIFDSNGSVLAQNVNSYTVIAYLSETRTGSSKTPLHVVDKKSTAEALAPVLGMSAEYIETLLNKTSYQVELGPGGRGITELKKEEIESLNLPGIDFIENYKRYYPNGDFASYIIGYAKKNEVKSEVDGKEVISEDLVGELGIESHFNDYLKGSNGYTIYQKDRFGYKIPDTKEETVEAVNGKDIYLTIDSSIQRFAEAAVKDVIGEYDPEWMILTVMDAKTGDILASATSPSFDPNVRDITSYENPLISLAYEPGSTMKTYTYMCALEKGTYNGSDTFKSGEIKIGDDTVKDWNLDGWGTITFDKGYEYSSNVGVSYIMQKFINKSDLRECLTKYGFAEKTDIELSNELSGKINFNYPIEVASAAFGQGITTTALQQLQALTIISNNGKMLKPHIVKKVVDTNTNEVTYEREVKESEQLVSATTISKMKDLMYNVIHGTDAGTTGRSYNIDGFDIIGKTGTSQIFDNKAGKYLKGDNAYIFSFAGMYPKDNPEIIIYGAMKKPKYGKNTALSIAGKSLMASIAKYKGMFSEVNKNASLTKVNLDSYINKNTTEIKDKLSSTGINVILLGDGDKIINQYPSKGTTLISGDKVILMTNDSNVKMPNIIGWSRQDAIGLFKLIGMKYNVDGYGFVTSHSIKKGETVNKDSSINITLGSKYDFESLN